MGKWHVGTAVLLGLLGSVQSWAMGKKPPVTPDPALEAPLAVDPLDDNSLAPTTPRPGAVDVHVDLRLTTHGVTVTPADLRRQILMAERVYSQCEGVNFHIHVVSTDEAPATRLQDNIRPSSREGLTLADDFQAFFSQFPNRAETGQLSIHFVDTLSADAREQLAKGQPVSSVYEGFALDAKAVDHLYRDSRSPQFRNVPLSQLGGNSVLLAWKTVEYAETRQTHINSPSRKDRKGNPLMLQGWRSRSSTLLAHEMGHILFERQDATVDPFLDHWCFGAGSTCPQDNVMSSGGYDDRVYLRVPELDRPIGYRALAQVEAAQCEVLRSHPLLKAGP